MSSQINQEQINDRAKLIMQRMVARELTCDPALVVRARAALYARAERMPEREFTGEWAKLLSGSIRELRRKLTSREREMARLRLSSPFIMVSGLGLDDVPLRRRIWRLAKRGLSTETEPVLLDRPEICIMGANETDGRTAVDVDNSWTIRMSLSASERPRQSLACAQCSEITQYFLRSRLLSRWG